MIGYLNRINEATLKVKVGGVKIGSAKYSRLAQINLKSRIITFSRYAIENVPERGRRYLVIHELAHIKEPNHNKRFWEIVSCFEPDYKRIEQLLEMAFQYNVKKEQARQAPLNLLSPKTIKEGRLLLPKTALTLEPENASYCFAYTEDNLGSWRPLESGLAHGGSEPDLPGC